MIRKEVRCDGAFYVFFNHNPEACMKRQHVWLVVGTAMLLLVCSADSFAQYGNGFASKGKFEAGGNVAFESSTLVVRGTSGNTTTTFMLSPFVGYFIIDGFELGFDPFSFTSVSTGGSSRTETRILLAPAYNFKTSGIVYPFGELLLGYTSVADGFSGSGFTWGLRGGVKLNVTGNGLLNLGLQYLQVNTTPSGETSRWGTNELSVAGGFTVWF